MGPARNSSSAAWRPMLSAAKSSPAAPGATSWFASRRTIRRTGPLSRSARRKRREGYAKGRAAEPARRPQGPEGRRSAEKAKIDRPLGDRGVHPYACLPHPDGKHLFVSLWADAARRGHRPGEKRGRQAPLPTARTRPRWSSDPEGKSAVRGVRQLDAGQRLRPQRPSNAIQTINCALYPTAPSGNTPNSLPAAGRRARSSPTPTPTTSVFQRRDPRKGRAARVHPGRLVSDLGALQPVDKRIYVANGKGLIAASRTAMARTRTSRAADAGEYIGGLFKGTVSVIDLPTPAAMATLQQAGLCVQPAAERRRARQRRHRGRQSDPAESLATQAPIKHCIYIIKENRTYDQVFGDLPGRQRRPGPVPVPARRSRRTTTSSPASSCCSTTSTSTARCPPTGTSGRWGPTPPTSSRSLAAQLPRQPARSDSATRPRAISTTSPGRRGGYLWDRCAEAKVSYRSYGEWIENGKKQADGTSRTQGRACKALEGHFDPKFRGFDLDYPDVKRAERFIEELKRFEKEGDMPQLHDPAAAQRSHLRHARSASRRRPAMVADNDLALGHGCRGGQQEQVLEGDGDLRDRGRRPERPRPRGCPPHRGPGDLPVHEAEASSIRRCTRRRSMLRTMELILGLKPMSQFDAAARPMYRSFTSKPDLTPYKHEVPKTDLKAMNMAGAWGADWSEQANLEKEDQADDLLFNEVIWKAVKGANSAVPPPVRAAFFRPSSRSMMTMTMMTMTVGRISGPSHMRLSKSDGLAIRTPILPVAD